MTPVKRPLSSAFLALCLVAVPLARAQETTTPSEAPAEVLDRIVAVVDEDPILASDLDRAIGLGLVSRNEDEAEEAFRRRVLDQMLEERLRAHEVDRFGFTEISLAEVDEALAALESKFEDRAAFNRRLQEFDLTRDDVRQIVARQTMVLTYVDERLGPRVFVSLDDIREYYDSVLAVEMRRQGKRLPALDDVREQIRRVLREQRLDEEIARWTEELRLEADIEDYFDRPSDASADTVIEVRSLSE